MRSDYIFSTLLLFNASLPLGFPLTGDLCHRDNPCGPRATCVIDPAAPIVGRPFCVCQPGFEGDGRLDGSGCNDTDECANGEHDCIPGSEICRNLPGSYRCDCESGYALHGRDKHCRDINECIDQSICGDAEASCVNIPGSYICACADPMKEYQNGKCVTRNFCADPDYNRCDPRNGICMNKADGAECLCKPGYELSQDQTSCIDIDECARNEHNCPPSATECVNEDGGYRCDCSQKKGWTSSGDYECINLNECEAYPDVCGELECCRDLPPPRKFLCSSIVDASHIASESLASSFNPMNVVSHGVTNLKRMWQKTAEEIKNMAMPLPERHLNSLSQPNWYGPPTGYPEFAYQFNELRQLGARPETSSAFIDVADNIMRYTVEAAAHVVPTLNGQTDTGTCPYGFIDLRPLRRRSSLQRVPETSTKLLNWLKDVSPIKLRDMDAVEPAAVAVGLAQNAKNMFDQMSDWYKALSMMPAALESAADSLNVAPSKDLSRWMALLSKTAKPFKDTVASMKPVTGSAEAALGSQDLYQLPVGI